MDLVNKTELYTINFTRKELMTLWRIALKYKDIEDNNSDARSNKLVAEQFSKFIDVLINGERR